MNSQTDGSPNHTPSRLKEALLAQLIEAVEKGEPIFVDGIETGRKPASASIMNAAIGFLKEFPPDGNGVPDLGHISPEMAKKYTQILKTH